MFKRKKKLTIEELKNKLSIAEKEKSTILTFIKRAQNDCEKADEKVAQTKIEYEKALFDFNQYGGLDRYRIESSTRKAFVLALAAYSYSEKEYNALLIRLKKAKKVYDKLNSQINKLENK